MRKLLLGLTALSMTMPIAVTSADAQTRYRSSTQRYYYTHRRHCHHGTTGALIGGGAGALVGSAVTHGATGPIVGAIGGALVGRHSARHRRC